LIVLFGGDLDGVERFVDAVDVDDGVEAVVGEVDDGVDVFVGDRIVSKRCFLGVVNPADVDDFDDGVFVAMRIVFFVLAILSKRWRLRVGKLVLFFV
jgi:hypothetical protein